MSRSLAYLAVLLMVGCDAGGRPPAGDGGSGSRESGAMCRDGVDNDRDGVADCADPDCSGVGACSEFDAGPTRDGGFTACTGTPYEANEAFAPIDIIWVVDTSGSMSNEAERVQENMQNFASTISSNGLDWRVVVISTQAYVNVPEPLASDPRYRLIDRPVSSNEPLRALLDEFPRYADFLRPSALTHFVAVTDDETDLDWMSFRTQMMERLRHAFIFHTICSDEVMGTFNGACVTDPGAFPPDGAAAPGLNYLDLARATGGLTLSICTPASEWTRLFGLLTSAIAVRVEIPCEYEIPEPPAGEDLDTGRVNIRHTPDSGEPRVYPYAGTDDGADCTSGGWYYDDPTAPTRIILCPATCNAVTGGGGRVDVELGCQTVLI